MSDRLETNKVIGDFVEKTIRDYFEESGFYMTPFGVEQIFGCLAPVILNDRYSDPSQRGDETTFTNQWDLARFLRSFPDFVAIRAASGKNGVREIFPVEVKFRVERCFGPPDDRITTVRLSDERLMSYQSHWPSTLLVVVGYHSRSIIGTRVRKLVRLPDHRVPIGDRPSRRSWFYDIKSCQFRPLWKSEQGWFCEERGRLAAEKIIKHVDEVRQLPPALSDAGASV